MQICSSFQDKFKSHEAVTRFVAFLRKNGLFTVVLLIALVLIVLLMLVLAALVLVTVVLHKDTSFCTCEVQEVVWPEEGKICA
jgi:hypothetical protein